jgi:hypothetical protein
MARTRSAYKMLVRNPKRRGLVEDLGVDGKIMLKHVLMKAYVRLCTDSQWSPVTSFCECGDKLPGSKKGMGFFE